MNSQWVTDLNVKHKHWTYRGWHARKCRWQFVLAVTFEIQDQKHNAWQKKLIKLGFIKIKTLCSTKDTVKRVRWQATETDKNILAKHIPDKGLLSKIQNDLLEVNNEKQLKNEWKI